MNIVLNPRLSDEHLPEILPLAVHIWVGKKQFVVVGYEPWKRKIKAVQDKKEGDTHVFKN